MWILRFILENKDALLALPQEVKIITVATFALSIGLSLIKSAWRFAKILALVAGAYFLLSWLGVF